MAGGPARDDLEVGDVGLAPGRQLRADHQRRRALEREQQLRDRARRQLGVVGLDAGDDVGGLAVDRRRAATRAAGGGSPASGRARLDRVVLLARASVSVVACSASVMKTFCSRIFASPTPGRAVALEALLRDRRVVGPLSGLQDRLEERDRRAPARDGARPSRTPARRPSRGRPGSRRRRSSASNHASR